METNDIKDTDTCVFKNLRPTERGHQMTTVIVSKEDRLRLLKRSLRIDLTNCRMSERIAIEKCFKCWNFTSQKTVRRKSTDGSLDEML